MRVFSVFVFCRVFFCLVGLSVDGVFLFGLFWWFVLGFLLCVFGFFVIVLWLFAVLVN